MLARPSGRNAKGEKTSCVLVAILMTFSESTESCAILERLRPLGVL